MSIVSNICSPIKDPFKVINEDKIGFFIWFLFTIIAGQLGVVVGLVSRYYRDGIGFEESIYLESAIGSFYTYGIAMTSSALGPLFASFIHNSKPKFSSLKIITISLTLFFLLLSSIIYASIQSVFAKDGVNHYSVDFSQLFVYLTTIFICVYSYCLLKIDLPKYEHLDDSKLYNEQDDEEVNNNILESKHIADDGFGKKI